MLQDDLAKLESDTTKAIAFINSDYTPELNARVWKHHEQELIAMQERNARVKAHVNRMIARQHELQEAINSLQNEAIKCEATYYTEDCPAYDTSEAQVILVSQYGTAIDKVIFHSKRIARHLLTIIHRA